MQDIPTTVNKLPLVLASASPRRRELLAQIGVEPMAVCSPEIDESALDNESVERVVTRLASAKVSRVVEERAGAGMEPAAILAADTLVMLDQRPLGKPVDRETFLVDFLKLANREHSVLTAVALQTPAAGLELLTVKTFVRFGPISREQAMAYWDTGEPEGKAGGYAVQGMGARFVMAIRGSYSNVVGLPLYETARMLTAVDVIRD